jgi:23S rRNA pseudouridine2605 synthase
MNRVIPKKATRRIGLSRALSKLGYCSRSQAAQLIRAGRVRLNEVVRFDPETPVHLTRDRILVEDRPIEAGEKIYLMMNKPHGLITTVADEKGRETVYSLLKRSGFAAKGVDSLRGASTRDSSAWVNPVWVAPVGRLDKASEGLLLLTNDSEWGARVSAPETHLPKTYHVQIARVADEALIGALTVGVNVAGNSGASSGEKSDEKSGDAETLRASEARLLRSGQKNCWLEIILTEGKNRQIRRMLQALGIDVLRLVRIAIGPLQLGKLAKGDYRRLTTDEINSLDRAMQARIP